MDRDQEKVESFTRRAVLVGGLQGLALAVLGGRLTWLQVIEGEKYKTLAENNRINIRILAPRRGQIVDRFGVPLADNLQNFQVILVPEQVKDIESSLADLRRIIPIDDSSIRRVLRQAKKNSPYIPIEVRDDLNWNEVSAVELHAPDLAGISVQAGETRDYPYKDATAHIIGYVGRVSEEDMSEDPLLSLPGFQVGKSGIEKYYEQRLQGKPGKAEVEVNVRGRPVRELKRNLGISGERIVLTIDAEFQRFVQSRLTTERSAAAVVMDVVTGEVYALASHPSYDPNIFAGGISAMDWEQLRDDPAHPLNNKVTSSAFPPGSTFKIVTMLAALEAGVINKHTTVTCPGHYDLGNNRFHCWKDGGHGTVDVTKAMAQSCDVFFYKLAANLGIERLAEMARRMGLGSNLDFDIPDVKKGLVPDETWKRGTYKKDPTWHPGETINASIGQGYMLASPLHLVTMLARAVNGGKKVYPWLASYHGRKHLQADFGVDLGIKPEHLAIVRQGLEAVVRTGGTAVASQIKEEGFAMGGKTGTSQVKRITKAERAQGIRRQEDMPWHLRHHALFVGYAPTHNPRYACAVIVEHGGGGSAVAAPIARDILLEIQKRAPASKTMEKN